MHIYPSTASFHAQLLGDAECEAIFAPERVLERLLNCESALTRALSSVGIITDEEAESICQRIRTFVPDPDRLTLHTGQDGVIVPELVRELRNWVGGDHADSVHLGATSQDLIDTATAMSLVEHARVITTRLAALLEQIGFCKTAYGPATIMGYTRLQKAVPLRFGHRMGQWQAALAAFVDTWPSLGREVALLQFGGPVGDRSGFDGKLPEVARALAAELGLCEPGSAWHTRRAAFSAYGSACASLAGTCGKIGRDMGLMARDGALQLEGGGTSSAMPHKSNPIDAEILVTIATYCGSLLPALHHSTMGEMERSGSMWTLEWMVLPQLCIFAAKSLSLTENLLRSVRGVVSEPSADRGPHADWQQSPSQ